MQFFETSITDKAAEILAHSNIDENNFDPLWEMLQQRYDNRRFRINFYLDILDYHTSAKITMMP